MQRATSVTIDLGVRAHGGSDGGEGGGSTRASFSQGLLWLWLWLWPGMTGGICAPGKYFISSCCVWSLTCGCCQLAMQTSCVPRKEAVACWQTHAGTPVGGSVHSKVLLVPVCAGINNLLIVLPWWLRLFPVSCSLECTPIQHSLTAYAYSQFTQ